MTAPEYTAALKKRMEENARCLNCGVPFCQTGVIYEGMRLGCPLHNLIPEWNDMLRLGNVSHALSRLLKVNCFPEFTGRICPAFCQRACIRGETQEPVAIRENELFIAEYGFEKHLMGPFPPPVRSDRRAAVIGSGPAGMAAAFYLNRRGHSVTIFEKADAPGGQLLQIQQKRLPHSVVARRISLLEQEGIVFRTGTEADAEKLAAEFDSVTVCTGPASKKDSLTVLAIAEGKRKAAETDRELMGYTSLE
mgnify:FL=1